MAKKLYAAVSILLFGALVFAYAIIIEERYCESLERNLYPKGVTIEELDRVNDMVIASDINGNLCGFHGCEDWEIGDIVAMIMDARGTPEIYDDVIVQTRCAY